MYRLLAVAAVAALSLTGCAAKDGTAPETVGYAADRPPVTIDFWYMPAGGPIQDQAVRTETEEFHALHPNITVRPVRIAWEDALTRLSTASTSGEGPDVTQLGTTWVGGFSSFGALRPYTDAEIAAVGGQDAFAAASWSSSHRVGSSEITAMPWLIDIRALFYRTDVLAKAGIDPETAFDTWESFEATLKKIKDSGSPVAPLAIGNQNTFGIIHNMAPFIWGAGGDLLDADGTRSRLAEPAAVEAVSYYQRLIALYDDPKAMRLTSSDVPAAFADGIGAVAMDNSQSVADFLADPTRAGLKAGWATAPMPAGKAGRFGFLGGSNLAILKGARHPDAAFEWVRFLTGKQSQQRYGVNSGLWPSRTEAVAGTKLATEPAYGAFREMIGYGRMYPSVPAWITVETIIAKNFTELWHAPGALSRDAVQAILTRTTADINEALKDPAHTGIGP
ncbi:extracellular solute-binding protein [Dactylosporangium fulvum]|uniref:Extracellular solute-binding protein n=1 Tax=Dactylosporangium fulvum TaxID=53359 RepID=A0ABY5VMW9_9ACTN|nr:extracellular solute-binding protein [Dactylosporangium fulvum]UWP78998.1 extracellular solute-binding protein [Dactylosporangium fulvum]